MRLIDADELMEHVWRDKLDSRAEIAKMVNNAPTVKDIPANVPIDMFDQLMLERKAGEKDSEQKPIDMDMTKALILGLLLGIDKKPDEKDKLREDLVKVFAPEQNTGHWIEDAGTYYKAIHERGCEPDENTPIFLDDIACSECLAKFSVIDNETERFECCPHCGAKMLEPKESEDKE